MNIDKQESERLLKSVQPNKVTSATLRKNDTLNNKKKELQSLISLVSGKLTQGKEMTVIVIETR